MASLTMPQPNVADAADSAGEFAYRPMSMLAVLAFVFGLLSATLMLIWFTLVIPAFNLVLAIMAIFKLRSARGEYSGMKLAISGLLLSIVALVFGVGYQVYLYNTELPKGHIPVSFSKDISAKFEKIRQGDSAVGPALQALDGQKIFVKGFMYPVGQQTGLTSFLLVKDNEACCFGGKPELSDMIMVYMSGTKTANYYSGRVSVTGTFRLNREYKGTSEMEAVFLMDGLHVLPSRSDFDHPLEPGMLKATQADAPPVETAAITSAVK